MYNYDKKGVFILENIITGKLSIDNFETIIELNNEAFCDESGFHIKKSQELYDTLSKRQRYLGKICFINLSMFNVAEAVFFYEEKYILFTFFNIENSIESSFESRGIEFYYSINEKKFIFKDSEAMEFLNRNYPKRYNLINTITNEIDLLLCKRINEIYIKQNIIDSNKQSHIIDIRGNYETKNLIKFQAYDITKEEALIRKSFQAEKLQALGGMASKIAHELNNHLMTIDGNIELGMKDLKIKENQFFLKALDASFESSRLIKSLLSFSALDIFEFSDVSLEGIIDDITNEIKLASAKNYQFILNNDLAMNRITIHGNRRLLVQGIINLINNGIESFNKSDNLIIMNLKIVYLNKAPANTINLMQHVSGKYLKIDIIDNGQGIPFEQEKRVFDPFYTTKDGSTGLGLAQTLGTVIKHKGMLELNSSQNGTTISLYVPCKEDNRQMSLNFDLELPKILVVDDDKMVLMVLEGLLKELKYDVISCSNPYEAISIYEAYHDRIELVISDMIMPKMNGNELFKRLKTINPLIKFILLSGYTRNNLDNRMLDEIESYIEKPIRKKDLEIEIKKALK